MPKKDDYKPSRFKWTVEFSIDRSVVAEGLMLTEEDWRGMLQSHLPYMYKHEYSVNVLGEPTKAHILKAQKEYHNAK